MLKPAKYLVDILKSGFKLLLCVAALSFCTKAQQPATASIWNQEYSLTWPLTNIAQISYQLHKPKSKPYKITLPQFKINGANTAGILTQLNCPAPSGRAGSCSGALLSTPAMHPLQFSNDHRSFAPYITRAV